MLNTPAPFPELGSWALVDRLGALAPARVTRLHLGRVMASISFPDRPTASGEARFPVAHLLDPTPLTREEHDEMEALAAHLAGLSHPERSTKANRFGLLAERARHAEQLVEALRRLNKHDSLATPATREAERHFAAAIAATAMKAAA